MVIACPPYIVARLMRPKRYACFLKARSLYYSYRNKHAQTGSSPRIALPTSSSQQHAAADRRLQKALSLFQQAVRLSQKQGELYDVVIGEYHMGLILLLQGQFQGAKGCFGRCQAISSSVRQDVNMVNTLKECAYYISVLP